MFILGGKNNFNDRFDFYEWSAPYYENPKEVFNALNSFDLNNKTLIAINAIGACEHIGDTSELYRIITDAGVELGDLWWEKYENLDNVLVPWEFELCEPIQFVFDDGTTLEILPIDNGGARIGLNTIPVGLVNGLNLSEVDATSFFNEFIGRKLDDIELMIDSNETKRINKSSISNGKEYKEFKTKYIIELNFGFPYKLELIQNWNGWYKVSGKGENWRSKISYQRLRTTMFSQEDSVKIVNGRDGGGTFWITGINSHDERASDIPNLDCFAMSIEDCFVFVFLSEFLYKYFDKTIQERNEYEEPEFDWYGINLYTFENMYKMVADIKQTIVMLQENYNDPALEKIKSHWSYYQYTDKRKNELTADEINELRKNVVPMAVDFYERFCSRMENMLKIPRNDMISFTGP